MTSKAILDVGRLLRDVRNLEGLLAKGALAAPLIAAWVRIGPPPVSITGTLATIAEALAILWTFHELGPASRSRRDRQLKYALFAFAIGTVSSVFLLATFSESPPGKSSAVIEGFWLRSDVAQLLSSSFTVADALRGAEYDPDQVWEKWSIVATAVLLYSLWIVTFMMLARALTILAIEFRRRRVS